MTAHRLAGAPRLVEWTGERCVPWAPDIPTVYEHFHRYLFAAQLAAGRHVLDLASGEGYGSALLADSARSVLGVDVDERAVEHSRLNYAAPNLEFRVADARELSSFEAGSFGAVVAFEVIEHVAEHEQLLAGVGHVLAPDGILILSTPERMTYSAGGESQNPFHARELSTEELLALLRPRFTHLATWAQRTVTGSALVELGDDDGDAGRDGLPPFIVERSDADWRLARSMSPMYVIAVASNAELPPIPRDSVLADPGQELLRAAEARAEQAVRRELASARSGSESLRSQLLELGDALHHERLYVAEVQQRAAGDQRVIVQLQEQLALAAHWRRGVEESVTWRTFQRARGRVYGVLGGHRSLPGRLLQSLLQRIGRLIS